VHLDSAYVDPSVIGHIADFDQHHVSFEPAATIAWFRSEPKRIAITDGEKVFGNLLPKRKRRKRSVAEQVKQDIFVLKRAIRESESALSPEHLDAFSQESPLIELAFICSNFLAVHPMVPAMAE
jgi:hypothetical protein